MVDKLPKCCLNKSLSSDFKRHRLPSIFVVPYFRYDLNVPPLTHHEQLSHGTSRSLWSISSCIVFLFLKSVGVCIVSRLLWSVCFARPLWLACVYFESWPLWLSYNPCSCSWIPPLWLDWLPNLWIQLIAGLSDSFRPFCWPLGIFLVCIDCIFLGF